MNIWVWFKHYSQEYVIYIIYYQIKRFYAWVIAIYHWQIWSKQLILMQFSTSSSLYINSLRTRQNFHHFADDIFRCISWMKMHVFCLRFYWNLFCSLKYTTFQCWIRQWFGSDQATTHYLNQWWLVYWCTYASFGHNGLTYFNNTEDEAQKCLYTSPQNTQVKYHFCTTKGKPLFKCAPGMVAFLVFP